MQASTRRGLLAGTFLTTLAVVALDVALTRVAVGMYGQHFSWFVPFVGALGLGAGATLASRAEPLDGRTVGRLALRAGFGAAGTVAALLVLLHVSPVVDRLAAAPIGKLAAVSIALALPFAAAGAVVGGSLRWLADATPRVVAAALGGVVVGVPVVLFSLGQGAMRVALAVSVVFAAAALAMYASARRSGEAPLRGSLVATFALCSVVLVSGDVGAPWLKLGAPRYTAEKPEFSAWSDASVVTVERPIAGQSMVRVDGAAPRPMLEAKTQPVAVPDDLGYVLTKEHGPTLVLGIGGGREVRVAAKAKQKDVYVAEPDPLLLEDVLADRYKTFAGDLLSRPEVHATLSDGRSYVRRSSYSYRNIVIGYGDTGPALGAGALEFTTDPLLTVDALADDFAHLEKDGVLVVTRADVEFERLLGLTATALKRAGVTVPAQNLFACGQGHAATLVARRTALAKADVVLLRKHCQRSKFLELFAPDDPHGARRQELAAGDGVADMPPPPTDERPVGLMSSAPLAWPALFGDLGALFAQQQGVVLFLGALAVWTLVALVLHVIARRADAARATVGEGTPRPLRSATYAGALGAGVVLLVAAFTHQLATFLGRLVYTSSAVLAAGALFGVVGAALAARASRDRVRDAATLRAEILIALIAAEAVGGRALVDAALNLPFEARFAAAFAMAAPFGWLVGNALPLGARLFSGRAAALPWMLGVGATASALALLVVELVVLQLGVSALWLAAGFAWLLAAITAPASTEPLPAPAVAPPAAPP
ncbi:MAG TPA: hypothetical protein VGM56_14200 [Byssovorax sp.]